MHPTSAALAEEVLQEVDAVVMADEIEVEQALTLDQILTYDGNLTDLLTDDEIGSIGSRVIRDVDIDESSREDWLKRYQRWLDLAMQVREQKTFPWPKASNIKYPLLTVAAIQFQARAYPAIVDGSNLVKGRVLAEDPEGTKRDRAERVALHMTWQLLYRMPGWEEDTDRLLLLLPIAGSTFRKTYHDTMLNQNVSEMVSAEDFIINYWAKSLDSAPRFTHVLRFYRHEVIGKVASGLWNEVKVQPVDGDSNDDDGLIEFYEQHRYEDLDGDGIPEPYVVTTTKQGEVCRIAPCCGPDDVTVTVEGGKMMRLDRAIEQNLPIGAVVSIERRQYFTKYGFIPAPDGSFYDIGFGWLLEDINESVNGTLNRLMDAGALQNAGGGFLGSGIQHKGGNLGFRIGEWKRVETTGQGSLKDNIFRMDHPGPSPVLFSLLQMLIAAAKEITSVQDILTGGPQPANTPATTTLAQVEQAQKVISAIFKRVHRSFGQELRILQRLNRDYLDEEEYFALNDDEQGVKVGRADYEDRDLDMIPVSDPNLASDAAKVMRAQALMMFRGDPLIDQVELRRRFLTAIGERDQKALLNQEPPSNPALLVEMMKEARAKQESAAKVRKSDADAAKLLIESAESLFMMGQMDACAKMIATANELSGEIDNDQPADGPGGVPGMEGGPPNAGLPGLPEGPAGGLGGGMVPGGLPDAGAAGAGGASGPAGGDQF